MQASGNEAFGLEPSPDYAGLGYQFTLNNIVFFFFLLFEYMTLDTT